MEIWKPVEQTPNRFRSEFEFSTPNFEPNPNLSEKTKSIGSNLENDAVRFQP